MSVVERLYQENRSVERLLAEAGEISLLASVDATSRKTLLLSAASYFEHRIREFLLDVFAARTQNDDLTTSVLRQKAIERQYHSYFEWEQKNANKFFSLFGARFLAHMKARVTADRTLQDAIAAFLELGSLRNQLVHLDFASFHLEKTADEIYELYTRAVRFIDDIERELRQFGRASEGG